MQDMNRQSLPMKDMSREPLEQIGYRPSLGNLAHLATNLRAIAHSLPVKHPKVEIPAHDSHDIGQLRIPYP